MNRRRDEPHARGGDAGGEAQHEVRDRFDAYVEDFRTRLDHGELAGTVGETTRGEFERLADTYRKRVEAAPSATEAERAFDAFKDRAQDLWP